MDGRETLFLSGSYPHCACVPPPTAAHLVFLQFWYALSEDPPFAVRAVSPQFCVAHRARGAPAGGNATRSRTGSDGGGGRRESSRSAAAAAAALRLRCELLQYASGLALGAGGRKLVLSYGVMDTVQEAWLHHTKHSGHHKEI